MKGGELIIEKARKSKGRQATRQIENPHSMRNAGFLGNPLSRPVGTDRDGSETADMDGDSRVASELAAQIAFMSRNVRSTLASLLAGEPQKDNPGGLSFCGSAARSRLRPLKAFQAPFYILTDPVPVG